MQHAEETFAGNQTNNNGEENYCTRPDEPANGHFLCDTNNVVQDTGNTHLLGTGSICQAKCVPTYSIPLHLQRMSIIECQNGNWNITGIELCYKEQPMRRHLARRLHKREKHRNSTAHTK